MEPTLRPVGEDDVLRLWEWSNDPEVRRQSFDEAPIDWTDHVSWFAARLQDPRSSMFVIESPAGDPVGVVRFAADEGGSAVVSIAISSDARGAGLGNKAIRAACLQMRNKGVSRVYAFIKPDNAASIGAFTRAGFTPSATRTRAGALAFEWSGGER